MVLRHKKKLLLSLVITAIMALPSFALAGNVKIAVAANFENAMGDIITRYKTVASGTTITPTYGASGTFYAEINGTNPNGYTLFFSADQDWAQKLVNSGKGYNLKDYAIGKLAVYSTSVDFTPMDITADVIAWLKTSAFTSGAVANPDVAPYGVAAMEFLSNPAVGLWGSTKIDATFPDIGATFNAANTGAKQVGFVAYAQTLGENATGTATEIAQSYYSPIIQSACLIFINSAINSEASTFLTWVVSGAINDILEQWGYAIPQ